MNAVNPVPTAATSEPSMEEILASIRRIIADDQSLPEHVGSPASLPHEVPDEPPTAGQTHPTHPTTIDEPKKLQAPTAASDLPSEHGVVTAPQFVSPGGPASVMAAPHPLDPRHFPEVVGTHSVDTKVPEPEFFREPEPDVHEAALRNMHDEPGVHLDDFAPQEPSMAAHDMATYPHDMSAHDVSAPDVSAHDVSAHDVSAHDVSAREVSGEAPGGLFSAATSQSLAAAFNTLAVSRLAADSAELRGLAQEMLRPMLKDWLDENLPSMVEGIIRDEIDRMSRGR